MNENRRFIKCNVNTIWLNAMAFLNCKKINQMKLENNYIFQNKLAFSESKIKQKR